MIGTRATAAVLLREGEVELQEFILPSVGSDDGLVRVELCGVCGADWSPYTGNFLEGYFRPPVILGHEIVGVVETIGAEAARRHGISEGDRIVVEEAIPCGVCRHCLKGRYMMCNDGKYGARSINEAPSLWGGYSEYLYLHPRAIVHAVPDGVSAELVPLFIPIANGLHWVRDVGGARPGDTVVVLGPGQHGLGCVIGSREAGAGTVIAVGLARDARRLEVARKLGADFVLVSEGTASSVVDYVREVTSGAMADVVINTADGSAQAFVTATDLAGDYATIVNVGTSHGAARDFHPDEVWKKELTIKGVRGRYGSVPAALAIIQGNRYPLELLSTHTYSLAETERALLTQGGRGDADPIHINVVPWG